MATDCLIISIVAQVAQNTSAPTPRLDPTTWVALALGAVATMYVLMRARKKPKDPLETKPSTTSLAQQRSVERQMSSLLVELSEMAREISANLDTRAAKLTALIDQADARIAHLRAIHADAPRDGASVSQVEAQLADRFAPARLLTDAQPPTESGRNDEVYALADVGRSVADIAQELGQPSGEIELILALRPRRLASAD